MVSHGTTKAAALRAALHRRNTVERRRKCISITVAVVGSIFYDEFLSKFHDKRAYHTSILSGRKWLDELLTGHPQRFLDQMGMAKHVFRHLLNDLRIHCGLSDSRYVTAKEQLAIFLHLARTGIPSRALQERFQRSGDTISK